MENKERSYQKELEGVRNDVAHLTSLLKQMLRARDGEGMFSQPDEAPPTTQIPVAPQNIGANTLNKKHYDPV